MLILKVILSITFMAGGQLISSLAQQQKASELFISHPVMPLNSSTEGVEGPATDLEGTLYWVNYKKEGTIGQMSTDGKPGLFMILPEGSTGNGIRFNSNGDMLIADYTGHNILKVEMRTGKLSILAHDPRMSQPNDIAVDSRDRIYASDPDWKNGTGRIWRVDTDGKVTLLDSLGTANGIEVSPDEKSLYVNASGKVYKYDLSPSGNVSNRQVLVSFPDPGMDGMRCDIKGNIYLTRFGKGLVVIVNPEGDITREIRLEGQRPTNLAFGGPDGCTVFVTLQDHGNIESFRTDIPGREWQMQKKLK
jgi:gluconolactonase